MATEFKAIKGQIEGLWIIQMKQVTDERGTVREFYRESAFINAGLPSFGAVVQINITETNYGAVRGLHAEAMNKLVAVASGEAFGAYVDLRPNSPTSGQLETVVLAPGTQVLVPSGVANAFQSTSNSPTQYLYAFDTEWQIGMPGITANPLDPAYNIPWPIKIDVNNRAQVSEKDATAELANTLDAQ